MNVVRDFDAEVSAVKSRIASIEDSKTAALAKLAKENAEPQPDADIVAMFTGKVSAFDMEINLLKAEIQELVALEKVQNIDWHDHESSIIKISYASTMATHSQVTFKGRKVIHQTLRKVIESTHTDQVAVLLQGPTGSGKTTAVKWIGGEMNRPVVSQNYSNNMEEVDVLGGPSIGTDGKVRMVDGPLTEAVRYGAIYVAEEMNFAKPGILAILNSLLDGNRQIILPSGEVVVAAPGFKFVGTINPNYRGTRELNRALVNRFGLIIEFGKPTAKQTIEIIQGRTGYGKTADERLMITKLIIYETTVDKLIKKEDVEANISVRQHFAAIRLMQSGETFLNAIKYGVADQVSNMDAEFKVKLLNIAEKIHKMSGSDLSDQVSNYFREA